MLGNLYAVGHGYQTKLLMAAAFRWNVELAYYLPHFDVIVKLFVTDYIRSFWHSMQTPIACLLVSLTNFLILVDIYSLYNNYMFNKST